MSKRYDEEGNTSGDKVTFAKKPIVSLRCLTDGYKWAKKFAKTQIKSELCGEYLKMVVPSLAMPATWIDDPNDDFTSFEEFKTKYFEKWVVVLPTNANEWLTGSCSCHRFHKNYICRHLVGMAIRMKYVTVPLAAKGIPLGQKRKRGRPSKAARALIVQ